MKNEYTVKEIAIMTGLTRQAIRYRYLTLGYLKKKNEIWLFNENQMMSIVNFDKKEFTSEVVIKEVIVETVEIYHSKINFL